MLPAIVVKSSAPTITGEPLIKPGADDDRVGGDLAADQRAEFAECPRIEQALDPRPGVELALAAVFGEPLRTTHRPRVLTATVEVVERLLPVRGLRHGHVLTRRRTY